MLISMIRRKTPKSAVEIAHLGPRPILGAVAKELDEVQRASRGGWTPELIGRALAALRVAGAYAINRPVGQRPAKPGETRRRRHRVRSRTRRGLRLGAERRRRRRWRPRRACRCAEDADGLRDRPHREVRPRPTSVRGDTRDEEQKSAHSLLKEGLPRYRAVVDLRKRSGSMQLLRTSATIVEAPGRGGDRRSTACLLGRTTARRSCCAIGAPRSHGDPLVRQAQPGHPGWRAALAKDRLSRARARMARCDGARGLHSHIRWPIAQALTRSETTFPDAVSPCDRSVIGCCRPAVDDA